SAALYGHSSGGCLALETALALNEGDAGDLAGVGDGPVVGDGPGVTVTRLAMYEAPYDDDPTLAPAWHQYLSEMMAALDEGRSGDAAALFMAFVGMPAGQIDSMRKAPFWAGIEATAPSLAYDHAGLMGADRSVPVERARQIAMPTLVMHGGDGAPFMARTAATLAKVIPGAELRTIPGQDHNVSAQALAPVLERFVAA
ncbi:MAG: alpha/beta fold hydrolase, partial [Streptosporangiaceae bacterium]